MPTLIVVLGENGDVASVRPVPEEVTPWTLRDGQHSSFPFVQPKHPLWAGIGTPDEDLNVKGVLDRKTKDRHTLLAEIKKTAVFNKDAFKNWPGMGLLKSLKRRYPQLATLEDVQASVVPRTIKRFLLACQKDLAPQPLLLQIATRLVDEIDHHPQEIWLNVAIALLLGKLNKSKTGRESAGALLFEAEGSQFPIYNKGLIAIVSNALKEAGAAAPDGQAHGTCALTGSRGPLVTRNFPQPGLHVLGQTYIFSKNKEIPANDRYGRFAAEAMPVGQNLAEKLAAALKLLTSDERKGVTWQPIPGEAPKQSDLLVAYVEGVPEAKAAEMVTEGSPEDDFAEEESVTTSEEAASVAEFERRTERIIEAVGAKLGADFRKTPVQLMVLRRLDTGNRKVVYAGVPTVGDLYDAAKAWASGERNVPSWLTLPVPRKGERKPRPMSPPHVAPLGVIGSSKRLYIRGDTKVVEVLGLSAAEAFGLFLDVGGDKKMLANGRAKRMLRLLLARRLDLMARTAHTLRRGITVGKKLDFRETSKKSDEALRTVTLLGVLLYKLGREEKTYMNETAFKLGQLLAAADVVHAGYCADVRGGDVPPSLLGNQVFTMAQSAPTKALATLCQRWKPYDGWAKKAARDTKHADGLLASKEKDKQRRGWDIKKALRYAREMGPLAAELAPALEGCCIDEAFRAELLLGYMAGLPKAQKEGEGEAVVQSEQDNQEED